MKFFLTSFFIFFFSTPAFSSHIYIAPVKGTGDISQQRLDSLRELIKVEVQNTKHQVGDSLETSDFYILAKLIRFKTYTLSMSRWEGNKKVSAGQWKANSLTDLEGLLSKAVTDILYDGTNNGSGRVLFENKKSLGELAKEKKQQPSNFERVEAKRQGVIGFGPSYFSNLNSADTALGLQGGIIWNIDDHFDLGLQSDFAVSLGQSDAYMFLGKVVTNYFVSTSDISPFVGVGFGYGWSSAHDGNSNLSDDSAAGFGFSLQAGVKFFRTSTINLGISADYTRIFDKNSIGHPSVFLIKVSLYY